MQVMSLNAEVATVTSLSGKHEVRSATVHLHGKQKDWKTLLKWLCKSCCVINFTIALRKNSTAK